MFYQNYLLLFNIYILGSVKFGFTLDFRGLPIDGLKKKYPNWDFIKDDQNISYFLNFASLFGLIGGFIIRLVFHYANAKKTICLFNIINLIIWLMYFLFSTDNFEVGIIFRSIQGVITGGFAYITPILMTNMSPDETVGMFGCINQFGVVLGYWCICRFLGIDYNSSSCRCIACKFKDKKDNIFQIKYAKRIFIAIMLMVF